MSGTLVMERLRALLCFVYKSFGEAHGSRAQLLCCSVQGSPSLVMVILCYEDIWVQAWYLSGCFRLAECENQEALANHKQCYRCMREIVVVGADGQEFAFLVLTSKVAGRKERAFLTHKHMSEQQKQQPMFVPVFRQG